MNGFSIYETYKQSAIEIEERHLHLSRHPVAQRRSRTGLRHQVARRGGYMLLKWGQALLHYSEPPAYRTETSPRSS